MASAFSARSKPWYKKKGKNPKGDRYVHVEGEPKHWELSESLKQHFGANNPPERKNLEFLIGLGNKIEHRHLPDLDPGLYGECQAALLNLEEMLTSQFGARYALCDQLAVSLQFTQIIEEGSEETCHSCCKKRKGVRSKNFVVGYLLQLSTARSTRLMSF